MRVFLLLLFGNHDSLMFKLHQRKRACLDERLLFIGSFKVVIEPGMINEEVLAQFIYKPAQSTEKSFLSRKNWKNYYSLYIGERGWVNAQMLLTNCKYIE